MLRPGRLSKHHRPLYLAAAAAFAGTILGGVAWACTRQATVSLLPQTGAAGSTVSVKGDVFSVDGSEPPQLEIHWGSVDGPVLAQPSGPSFSVSLQVPPGSAPGIGYMVVVQRDREGRVAQKVTRTFEVKSSAPEPGPAGTLSRLAWPHLSSAALTIAARPQPGLAIGAGILALGLLAACAGGFVFLTRRQRVSARPERNRTRT